MKDRRHNSLIALLMVGLVVSLSVAPARIVAAQSPAAAAAGATEVVIVLPFENASPLKEYNWVGASFADAMSELLNVPGLVVASGEERELAYKRLRLPLETLPSRATAIKIAREARATLVVLGTYDVTPTQGESAPAEIRGTARVIKVNEGRLTGELMADGRWGAHQWDFGGPLKTLQTMQGRLSYQVLYQRDQALAFSLNQFLVLLRLAVRPFEHKF